MSRRSSEYTSVSRIPKTNERSPRQRAAIRPVLWRVHFLGGILAAPIVFAMAITGILYAWNPQLEHVLHRQALSAIAEGPARPLSEQISSARETRPELRLSSVTPAAPDAPSGEETTAVTLVPETAAQNRFEKPKGAVTVYVDPASAEVTGSITESNRPDEWLRNLHSNFRIGKFAEPISELAASWLLVSVLTGLVLWWPRDRRSLARNFLFRKPGRPRWRSLHGVVGATAAVGLVLLIVTGLTWTTYAGSWVDVARSQFDSDSPEVSTVLHPDTGSEQAGSTGNDPDTAEVSTAGVERVAAATREAGLHGVVVFEPPDSPGHAWKAEEDDSRWPVNPTALAVNGDTGEIVDRVEWADYPPLAKATSVGIDFHQAQLFGLTTQLLLTAIAVASLVLIIAGYRVWLLRRPAGSLGAPPRLGPVVRNAPWSILLGFGLLTVLLPVLGITLLGYLAIERAMYSIRTGGK
ncbi:PepSY-associated TM helix domain-containing protein [Actinopolyspora sp. H202]|uniref:PepSY-associated TM helix domain-containing protein n=1 Tax=Actinopolyspora sp. H202 TaxID=1500456 RepID=UPI003EE4F2E3